MRQPQSTRTSSQPTTQGKPNPGVTTAAALGVLPVSQVSADDNVECDGPLSSDVDGNVEVTGVGCDTASFDVDANIEDEDGLGVTVSGGSTVSGTVRTEEGDVTVLGDSVVSGNFKTDGGDLTVSSDSVVSGNVKTDGGDLTLEDTAEVGENIKTKGGAVTTAVGTTVGGNIKCGGGTGSISGSVGGDIEDC